MRRGRPPYPGLLTPREQEVLALLQEGLTNEEIAERLGISRDGAKFHVSEILSKLGVQSRHQAAAWQRAGGGNRFFGLAFLAALWKKLSLTRAVKVTTGAALAGGMLVLTLIALGILIMDSRAGREEIAGLLPTPTPEDPFAGAAPAKTYGAGPQLVYRVPGMDDIQVRRDITYKALPDADLNLDLYVPADTVPADRHPAVVFVHGSAPDFEPLWAVNRDFKRASQYVGYGHVLSALGFAAVTFNHRTEGYLDDAERMALVQEDIDDLLTYVIENADSLNIDPERICVWDIQAPFGVLAGAKRAGDAVRCIVSYYGLMDIRDVSPDLPEDLLARYSPILQINEAWPPTFIARAEEDDTRINDSIDAFEAEALSNGLVVEVMNHDSGCHGFDVGVCPGWSGAASPEGRSREIIEASIEFVMEHLK